MGIPSYFKHIIDRYPRLLTNVGPETGGDILLVDFNCLIYGCISSKSLPLYTHETREKWEAALLKEICAYVTHLWKTAGKPGHVLLAVDGVVPMAKIRQQRLRRFKSIWIAAKERECGVREIGGESWDTNSITPGTEFMEHLTRSLQALSLLHGGSWIVSGAEEPGEGEQKLMQWVRRQDPAFLEKKHIIVYGLDADLIILCMLHRGTVANKSTWSILREKQEFLKKSVATDTTEKYPPCLLLSVSGFEDVLFPDETRRTRDMYDYIAGMSLLGNDFIPHSLGVHLRDAGHDRLLSVLSLLHSESIDLIVTDTDGLYKWNPVALSRIFEIWSGVQEDDLEHAFKKKYTTRTHPPRTDRERKMLPIENLPLELAEEDVMWNRQTGKLREDWKDRYYMEKRERFLTAGEIQERCSEYCRGLQWALDYYLGQREVSQEWVYPWTYPPMWSELLDFLRSSVIPQPPLSRGLEIQPQEQLTLVLPLESWSLIRNPVLKSVPNQAPQFWPSTFTFSTLGKRWMWECPPRIPIMSIRRLLILTHNRTVTE
jgi:5'-3' exonuclease